MDVRAKRNLRAKLQTVQPTVTTAKLAAKYPSIITVDRGDYKLRLFKDLELAKTYTSRVGQAGLETPAGAYTIQNKAENPSWHVPQSAWAGDLAGTVVPPGPGQPDQGALDGHLRRRRHPRHRQHQLDRHARLPRLRPDAHPGRRGRSTTRSRSGRPCYIV